MNVSVVLGPVRLVRGGGGGSSCVICGLGRNPLLRENERLLDRMLLSVDETGSLRWWDTLERLSRVCLRSWTVLLMMMLGWDATAKS